MGHPPAVRDVPKYWPREVGGRNDGITPEDWKFGEAIGEKITEKKTYIWLLPQLLSSCRAVTTIRSKSEDVNHVFRTLPIVKYSEQDTTFRKLNLFPSSGEKTAETPTELGSIESSALFI